MQAAQGHALVLLVVLIALIDHGGEASEAKKKPRERRCWTRFSGWPVGGDGEL